MAEARPAQRDGKAEAGSAPQPLMSVRGLGIRFKTSQGVWQATRKIDFDIAAGRTRRHRRRERLRQDHHRPFDPAAVAEQSCRPRRLDPVRRRRSRQMQHPRHARHQGPPHCHDLPGADERARSGLHRRPPDLRDAARPYRRRQGRGEGAHPRHAPPRRHRLAGAAHRRLSASALRRHAPARDDRGQPDLRAAIADRGRADHRARRHRAGADPGTAARPQRDLEHGVDADHARPRRRRRDLHAHDHDVCRRGDRGCRGRRRAGAAVASLYIRPVALAAAFEPAPWQAAFDPRPGAFDHGHAQWLPLQGAMSPCHRRLREGAGTARCGLRPQGTLLAFQ